MSFTNKNPVAVEFESVVDGRLRRTEVPLSEIASHHAVNGGWVQRVGFQQEDGSIFWSYGKSWVMSDTNKICRVGAGASGDLTVWRA